MHKWLLLFPVLTLTTFAQSAPSISPVTFQSSTRQTQLLELFTSEGCSSCPPAETWLTGLKNSPGLWKDFVPVAWHVDYWNYLGWNDPWSNEDYAGRQRSFAAQWHSENIYTPELVLNGKEWSPWFKPKSGPAASQIDVGVLTASSSNQTHWHVEFTPSIPNKSRYQIHAALLASGLVSDVKAGENNGRHLNHDFVALAFAEQYLPFRTNEFRGDIILDANKVQAGQPAMAFWVTRINELEPVQAVGGWLVSPEIKKP